ncbi:MAG: hypothetical protein ACK5L1_18910, partial [Pseudanabaena sp.]
CFVGNSLFFLLGNPFLTLILFLGIFLVDSQSIIPFLFTHYFPRSPFFRTPYVGVVGAIPEGPLRIVVNA